MNRKFVFLEDYPTAGPMWEKVLLSNADLEEYFKGLPRVAIHQMLLDFLFLMFKDDIPEARMDFARNIFRIVDFLGKEVFEDEEDFNSFVEMRKGEVFGQKEE